MPKYAYRRNYNTSDFVRELDDQIPGSVSSISSVGMSVLVVDIPSSSKADLDEYLEYRNFTYLFEIPFDVESISHFGKITSNITLPANSSSIVITDGLSLDVPNCVENDVIFVDFVESINSVNITSGAGITLNGSVSNSITLNGAHRATLKATGTDEWELTQESDAKVVTVTSSSTTSFTQGGSISYTITTDLDNASFDIIDTDSTGLSVNFDTGVLSGGGALAAGDYDIEIFAGNFMGRSHKTLTITVNP